MFAKCTFTYLRDFNNQHVELQPASTIFFFLYLTSDDLRTKISFRSCWISYVYVYLIYLKPCMQYSIALICQTVRFPRSVVH